MPKSKPPQYIWEDGVPSKYIPVLVDKFYVMRTRAKSTPGKVVGSIHETRDGLCVGSLGQVEVHRGTDLDKCKEAVHSLRMKNLGYKRDQIGRWMKR